MIDPAGNVNINHILVFVWYFQAGIRRRVFGISGKQTTGKSGGWAESSYRYTKFRSLWKLKT